MMFVPIEKSVDLQTRNTTADVQYGVCSYREICGPSDRKYHSRRIVWCSSSREIVLDQISRSAVGPGKVMSVPERLGHHARTCIYVCPHTVDSIPIRSSNCNVITTDVGDWAGSLPNTGVGCGL